MPRPKVIDGDFIDFLIATPRQATATEAQRTQPAGAADPAAYDAYARLLHRLEPDSAALWQDVRPDVRLRSGVLILDDSVQDKPYARRMDLVHHQWSGKHHDVVPFDSAQGEGSACSRCCGPAATDTCRATHPEQRRRAGSMTRWATARRRTTTLRGCVRTPGFM